MEGFVTPEVELERGFVEDELTKSEWFAGSQFTAADIIVRGPET